MDHSPNQNTNELVWDSFRYINGELSQDQASSFEKRLAVDQQAREAVAEMVRLQQAIYAAELWDGQQPRATLASAGRDGAGNHSTHDCPIQASPFNAGQTNAGQTNAGQPKSSPLQVNFSVLAKSVSPVGWMLVGAIAAALLLSWNPWVTQSPSPTTQRAAVPLSSQSSSTVQNPPTRQAAREASRQLAKRPALSTEFVVALASLGSERSAWWDNTDPELLESESDLVEQLDTESERLDPEESVGVPRWMVSAVSEARLSSSPPGRIPQRRTLPQRDSPGKDEPGTDRPRDHRPRDHRSGDHRSGDHRSGNTE